MGKPSFAFCSILAMCGMVGGRWAVGPPPLRLASILLPLPVKDGTPPVLDGINWSTGADEIGGTTETEKEMAAEECRLPSSSGSVACSVGSKRRSDWGERANFRQLC